jgi:zinc protease
VEILSPSSAGDTPTREAIRAACTGKKAVIHARRGVLPKPKLHVLGNGMRLIIRENHMLPIVAVYAVMPGGLRFETARNNGISYLASRTLTKGTERRSAIEIAEKIESIAGVIDGFCGRNTVGVRTEFLSEKLHDGFGLFSEVITSASFDDKEVEKERAQQIESIHNQEDHLHSMAFVHFLKQLYPGHPYGFRMLGEASTVKRLTSGQLKRWWQERLNPAEMCISVVGDVSPSEVIRMTKDWIPLKKKPIRRSINCHVVPPDSIRYNEVIKKGKEQSHIVLGFLGTVLKSADHYRLSVLNHILAGQGGRLFVTLRDKMSLAYSVNSTLQSGMEPGYFAVYIGTDPAKTDTAIKAIKRELEQIRKEPVSREELERAKQYMVGTFELEQQKNRSLASAYAFNVIYELGLSESEKYPQRIMKVTRDEILATARKYINMDAYVLSVIKPK